MPAFAPPAPGHGGVKALIGVGVVGLLAGGIALAVYSFRDAGGPATAKKDPPIKLAPKGPPLSEEQKKINQAVAKGVAYLKRKVHDTETIRYHLGFGNGPHAGAMALLGLTLLECGVPPDDPAVVTALKRVQAEIPQLTFTYALAAAVLFLDRLDDPGQRKGPARHREQIQALALQLIRGQNEHGGWSYTCRLLKPKEPQQLLHELADKKFKPGPSSVNDDNSNVQFATLALWVARKHGVPTAPALALVANRFRNSQNPDGSWGYRLKTRTWRDSMTCAGLLGLAVGWGLTEGKGPGKHPAIDKGFQYLNKIVGTSYRVAAPEAALRHKNTRQLEEQSQRFAKADKKERAQIFKDSPKLNVPNLLRGTLIDAEAEGDLYFLWSLQRTATIYDLKTIAGKDWYAWASAIIVASQKPDGSWDDRFPGVPDTCFALLFLRRANLVKDLTDKLRTLGVAPGVGNAPPPQGSPPAKKD